MDEELKKELDESTSEEFNDSLEEESIDFEQSGEDPLNVNISVDDIKDLTEEECDILFVKLEVAIDECENKIEILLDESFVNDDENNKEEYTKTIEELKRLKQLEKLVHKQKSSINKNTKEGGLFGNLPVWAFVLFIICALFTIIPVNPHLPIELYILMADKFQGSFLRSIEGAYFCYFVYIGIFFIVELVIFIILLIRGLKSKDKMGTFKSYLVMFIINVIIYIPGIIIFLNAVLNN